MSDFVEREAGDVMFEKNRLTSVDCCAVCRWPRDDSILDEPRLKPGEKLSKLVVERKVPGAGAVAGAALVR